MITQNNEMMKNIIDNLEVAEMLAESTDPNEHRIIKESVGNALAYLYQLANLAAIPENGVIQ